MAITRWSPAASRPTAPTLAETFHLDPALLQTRAAQAARRRGVLLAKEQALAAAERLLRWGRLLACAIILISALHVWESVAAIAPKEVPALHLPAALYHLVALTFTLLIDVVAIFLARTNAVAALVAGAPQSRWTAYFYAATGLLNASYICRHAPGLDATTQQQLLPLFAGLFVVLLPLSVPIGIVAVEGACRTLEAARLALLMEIATLRDLDTSSGNQGETAGRQKAAGRNVAAATSEADVAVVTVTPALGGRPQQYRVEDLVEQLGGQATFSPADAQRLLGASESTTRRLLAEGQERGLIVRREVGVYMVQRAEDRVSD